MGLRFHRTDSYLETPPPRPPFKGLTLVRLEGLLAGQRPGPEIGRAVDPLLVKEGWKPSLARRGFHGLWVLVKSTEKTNKEESDAILEVSDSYLETKSTKLLALPFFVFFFSAEPFWKRVDRHARSGDIWLWLSKPFWDPILG